MDLGLKDATAVVVGGGRGMGLAAARCLADDGARVALVGRTADVLDRAAEDLADRGSPDALGLVADTTDAEAVQRVFDELSDRWGGELNVLINAVGPWHSGHVRRSHRRSVAGGLRRRRDGHGALRAVGAAAAAKGAVGADRQLLRPFDATSDRHPARLHGRQGGRDKHLEEPLVAAGQGRDHGQRRLTGQHRVRGACAAGPIRSASTAATPMR